MLTILTRFLSYAALMPLFGLVVFTLSDRRSDAPVMRSTRGTIVAALLAIVAAGLALVALAADFAGVAPAAVDRDAIRATIAVPAIATAFGIRLLALATILVASSARIGTVARERIVALASGAALATFALTGHAAAGAGVTGWLRLVADMIHILAAAWWLGAIVGLAVQIVRVHRTPDAATLDRTWRALHGFARTGSLLVAAIALTGLINLWAILGLATVRAWPDSLYGRLLIAKLLLFVAMLGLASLHRFHHVPGLGAAIDRGTPGAALARLRRSLLAEGGCAAVILLLVAWLGTLDPTGSV